MVSFSIALLALVAPLAVLAQTIVEEASFGHKKESLSPSSFTIPGWQMLGEGHVPYLLSDKVILTPPFGAGRRGALWSEKANTLLNWSVDYKFRGGAVDKGSGTLHLWYAKDGEKSVSTGSIYSIGKWEGLSIVMDTVGGKQKIRGFLSDGTIDYKSHTNVDSLAFGHCDYVHRNLGRPSLLQVKSTRDGLEVRIDETLCFTTPKVNLPAGYTFGTTAVSNDPPDSYEVFSFVLSSAPASVAPPPQQNNNKNNNANNNANNNNNNNNNNNQAQEPIQQTTSGDDKPASDYTTSQAQFEDLHNRLTLMSKSITTLFQELNRQASTSESRHREIMERIPNAAMISSLDSRFSNLDRMISSLERELKTSDHSTQFRRLSEQLKETHQGVTEQVPARLREYVIAHTPRIGFILYSFMAFQTCVILAVGWHKWRKGTMPKKYL